MTEVQESSIHGEIIIQEGTRSRDAHITGRVKDRRCQVKFPRISRRSEREPCGQGASKSCQTSMNDVREYAFLESRRAGPKNTSARDESSFPANPGEDDYFFPPPNPPIGNKNLARRNMSCTKCRLTCEADAGTWEIQIFKNGEDLRWRAYLHTYLSVSESEEVRGGVRASYSQRKRKELTLLTY